MPKPESQTGRDGRVVYGASTATLVKLKIVEHYLDGYATVMEHHNVPWHCLDLFAGPGRNVSEVDGAEVDGSPILALRAPTIRDGRAATSLVAIEKDIPSSAALEARIAENPAFAQRAKVLRGSHQNRLTEALGLIPPSLPSFALLDPEGFDVPWATLERLATHRQHRRGWKMELLILFPSTSVVRLREEKHWPRVDEVYGGEEWRGVLSRVFPPSVQVGEQEDIFGGIAAVQAQGQRPSPQVAADQFVQQYADKIRDDLGYSHVQPIQVRKAGSAATDYHLVFATDNSAGAKIMQWVAEKAPQRVPGPEGWEVLNL